MKHLIHALGVFVIILSWLVGIVLANGFWSTAFAMCIPPYGWYLVIEKVMIHWGIV